MSEDTPSNPTVLVVEDDDDIRFAMRLQLEQRGYHVIEVGDGRKAVEMTQSQPPDFVLMDLSLPGMDGLEATQEIRKDARMAKVPIVAVTAHQETDFREGAKSSGFDAYVTKPIDFDWLNELLTELRG